MGEVTQAQFLDQVHSRAYAQRGIEVIASSDKPRYVDGQGWNTIRRYSFNGLVYSEALVLDSEQEAERETSPQGVYEHLDALLDGSFQASIIHQGPKGVTLRVSTTSKFENDLAAFNADAERGRTGKDRRR
jgi:hypothetical protein